MTNETITLSRDTYDKLVEERNQYHYLRDAIMNGYKTHAGDYERAVFVFYSRPYGEPVSIVAESESETIIELNKINKQQREKYEVEKNYFNKTLSTFKHLFGKLYIKR